MKKTVFSIDGSGAFVGVHNPDNTWNGWAIPYFTKEEAIRFLEFFQDSEYWKYSYDADTDTFRLIEIANDDVTEWTGEQIDGQTLYCIGGQYLVWVAEDDKTFFCTDHSGRDGHGSVTLVDIVEDEENQEEHDEAEEDEKDDTLIAWAMNAEIGDEYTERSNETYLRTA